MTISQAFNLSTQGRDRKASTCRVLSRNLFLAMPILTVPSQTHDAGVQILENLVNICMLVMVVLRQIVQVFERDRRAASRCSFYSPWRIACSGDFEQFLPRGWSFAAGGIVGQLWHWQMRPPFFNWRNDSPLCLYLVSARK